MPQPQPIPVNEPLFDGNEKKYVLECVETGWVSSEGPFVTRFEELAAKRFQRKHAIAVCNGTAALEVAVAALELPAGSEVILPAFTIISCALAVVRARLVPVLVDSDPQTWNFDLNQLESKITEKTRAILPVHIYGLPVDMQAVQEIAKKRGLRVVEDAAEAIGQTCRGKPCGSFGDASIFSFYPNKHVTTGEGGMVLTDDDRIAEKARSLRNLCFDPARRFIHEELGHNFRMTNLQAALGLAQLESLDRHLELKRRMGARYQKQLVGEVRVQLPLERTDCAENLYWVFGVVGREGAPDALEMMRRLAERKIGTRHFFWPLHQQPAFQRAGLFKNERHPVAERLANRGFYLPSGLALREEQIDRAADALRACLG
ncbi:MAG: DegT/DnrJ/EryC1/StrS aminotransferase family protein [Verrucomicrobiae bacterium]|nr:DegT/DnrJ/EryC1/StrS aminotransferase family protein [Verrucomicrobiae bacterium]